MPRVSSVGRQTQRSATGQTLGNTRGTVQDDWRIPFSHRAILQALRNLQDENTLPLAAHDPNDPTMAHYIHSGLISLIVRQQGHTREREVVLEIMLSPQQPHYHYTLLECSLGEALEIFDHINQQKDAALLTSFMRPQSPMAKYMGLFTTPKVDHEDKQRRAKADNDRYLAELAKQRSQNTTTIIVGGVMKNIPHTFVERQEQERQRQMRNQFVNDVAKMIVNEEATYDSLREEGLSIPDSLIQDINHRIKQMAAAKQQREKKAIERKRRQLENELYLLEKQTK